MTRAPAERREGSQQSNAFAPTDTAIITPPPVPEEVEPPTAGNCTRGQRHKQPKFPGSTSTGLARALLYIAFFIFMRTLGTRFPRECLRHARDPEIY